MSAPLNVPSPFSDEGKNSGVDVDSERVILVEIQGNKFYLTQKEAIELVYDVSGMVFFNVCQRG